MAPRQATQRAPAPTVSSPVRQALSKLAQNFTVDLTPFQDESRALAFKADADGILKVGITTAETHRAAQLALREGKSLKRAMDEHWSRVTRWLEDRKKDVRSIMALDLEHVEPGIKGLNDAIISYEQEDARRRMEEDRRLREEQERIAKEARERELAQLEWQALANETHTEELSERELLFTQKVYAGLVPALAAQKAGYKDAVAQGRRLMATPKIQAALEGMKQAEEIRRQAAAVAEKPLEVRHVETDARTAKVAGVKTMTTHTGEVLDSAACVVHLITGGDDAPPPDLFMVNPVKLNEYARSIHENIERWHGVRYVRKTTKAG